MNCNINSVRIMFLIQSLLYATYESRYQKSLLTKEDPHPLKNYGSLAIFRGYLGDILAIFIC